MPIKPSKICQKIAKEDDVMGLGWLFGNSASVEKAVDAVINTGDALFFTDEEKSVASQKILDWKIEYAKATQNQSVSRRIIAVGVTAMWCIVGLSTLAAKALGHVSYPEYAMQFMVDVVMQPFSIIVGFYFLTALVGKATNK